MTTTSPEPLPDPDPDAVAPGSDGGGEAWDLGRVRREVARLVALPPGPRASLAEIMAYDAQADAEEAEAAGYATEPEADADVESAAAELADAGPASSGPADPGTRTVACLDDLDAVLKQLAGLEAQVARLHGQRAGLLARAHELTDQLESDLLNQHDPNVRRATTSRRRELAHRTVTADIATTLRLGEHATTTMTDHAITLTRKAPATLTALCQGALTWAHATQLAGQVADLDPREAREVENTVLAQGLACTPTQLGARARHAREHAHPVPLDVRHSEARGKRAVWLDAAHDGMACLTALLPATIATAAFDRLTRTAKTIRDHEHSHDHGRTPDQLRADTLAALLLDDGTLDHTPTTTPPTTPPTAPTTTSEHAADDTPGKGSAGKGSAGKRSAGEGPAGKGPALGGSAGERPPDEHRTGADATADADADAGLTEAPDGPALGAPEDPLLALLCEQSYLTTLARSIRPRVNVTVPVMTLLGKAETPGTLDGHTPIDASTARRLAACAPSFHRLLTHPETGTVLSVGRSTYTVPADLKTYLEQRDLTCRFPGCRRPAHRSDVDHTIDWANGGHTEAGNLAHLCRHHHVLKHQTRWQVRHIPDPSGVLDGTLQWTSPTGHTHTTTPEKPDATIFTRPPWPGTDADHREVSTSPTSETGEGDDGGEDDDDGVSTSSTGEGLVSTSSTGEGDEGGEGLVSTSSTDDGGEDEGDEGDPGAPPF